MYLYFKHVTKERFVHSHCLSLLYQKRIWVLLDFVDIKPVRRLLLYFVH